MYIIKKLSELQINSEKLIKNEELMNLRGGYGSVGCSCQQDGNVLCSGTADNCGDGYGSCKQWCMYYCPNFEYAICAG